MRKGGGFQSHNIFDVLEDTQNKKTRKNNESDDDSSDDEEQSYYCLEISGLPLFVEKTQFLPIASDFGPITHIDCEKSGYVYVFYDEKHVATKTLMSIDGKRYQGKRMHVQFAPNKALPAVKKCYHCDKLGHFGIDCVEGPLASMPEEIIALMCSFVKVGPHFSTAPMKVNKKWKRAIAKHTSYLEVYNKWSPLFDKFNNLNTLHVYDTAPNDLKCFPKLQTLVADINVFHKLIGQELPPSLKHVTVANTGFYVVSALPQTWTQQSSLAGLESLSFQEDINGLPFSFADVTHLTNLKRLDLPSAFSPKEHLSSLTKLEHLGCATFDDLTLSDAKYLQKLTSFAALQYKDHHGNPGYSPTSGSYTWLADLAQMKAITLNNIDNDFNFKLWPHLQSLTIADVAHLPDTLDQLNAASLTELHLKIHTLGRFSKLSNFTNLVKLKIDVQMAANSVFMEIVKLKNLRRLEFSSDGILPVVEENTVGLSTLPNLEYFSLTASVHGFEGLFLDEICELSTLKSVTFNCGFENHRFMDIIRRFNNVNVITIWGSEGIKHHHVIALRNKLKGPEYFAFNGSDAKNIKECTCKECREKNLAGSLDHLAIDPAPAVLAMEDHMLDIDEIRYGRNDEREKKMKKHDKTKMQRIEKQGNLSEKELRKKRNRRK